MDEPMKNQSEVEKTLEQRGSVYGPFTRESEMVDAVMRTLEEGEGNGNAAMRPDLCRHATYMIVTKLVRAWNGEIIYADNWHDMGGYAKLAENFCNDHSGKGQ